MRILGVDYGMARIGLAVSDPTGFLAQGLSVLQRKSDEQAIEDIAQIVQHQGVELVVVGFPRNMNGTVGDRAQMCERFAKQLESHCNIPVDLYDERLTTVAAQRMLIEADVSRKRRKQVVDAVAATLMLQGYLDNRANRRDRETRSTE